jgi:hypothetical protein
MTEHGFATGQELHDSYGWDISCSGSCYTSTMEAHRTIAEVKGNAFDERHHVYFKQDDVRSNRETMENHLGNMTTNNQNWVQNNPRMWRTDISTNDYGWAALEFEDATIVEDRGRRLARGMQFLHPCQDLLGLLSGVAGVDRGHVSRQ